MSNVLIKSNFLCLFLRMKMSLLTIFGKLPHKRHRTSFRSSPRTEGKLFILTRYMANEVKSNDIDSRLFQARAKVSARTFT